MGASNFYKVNAEMYYVVCNHSPEEEGDADFGRWMVEDLENMFEYEREHLSKRAKDGNINYYHYKNIKSQKELRNYPASYLGSFDVVLHYCRGKGEVVIRYHCFMRAGYYEAACLDWESEIIVDGENVDEFTYEEFRDASFFDYSENDSAKGVSRFMYNFLKKRYDKHDALLKEYIHLIFNNISTPYNRVGGFSDGTSVYEPAKPIDNEINSSN